MGLFRQQHKESTVLVVSLESGAVRGGIVLLGADRVPTLVFETVRHFEGAAQTSERLVGRMCTSLEQVCNDITRDALPHIVARTKRGTFDSVRIVYGAPWYVSRGRTVSVEHDAPRAYSARELDALIVEQSETMIPSNEQQLELIERFATGWSINGYPVNDPVDKPGKRISLNLFASAVPSAVRRRVEDTLARWFRAPKAVSRSSALVASIALTTATSSASTMLVTVTGLMTELALLSRDIVLDVITFPEGVEHTHAAWSASARRLPHEARTHARRGSTVAMSDSWVAGIRECLSALSSGRAAPETVALIIEKHLEPTALAAVRDAVGLVFGKQTHVVVVTEHMLGSRVRVATGALPGSVSLRLIARSCADEVHA